MTDQDTPGGPGQDERHKAAAAYGIANTAIVPGEHHLLIPMLQKTTADHFLAGITYRDQNPPAEVLALIEALRYVYELSMLGTGANSIEASRTCNTALSAWRKRGGGSNEKSFAEGLAASFFKKDDEGDL